MRSTPMRYSVSDQALEDTIVGIWEIGEPSTLSLKLKDSGVQQIWSPKPPAQLPKNKLTTT